MRVLPLMLVLCVQACALGEDDDPIDAREFLEQSDRKDDFATYARWLWPGGDVYAIPEAMESVWGTAIAGARVEQDFRDAARLLARNTPVRIHFITHSSQADNGYYISIEPGEGPGRATIGTQSSELSVTANAPRHVRHELGHVVGLRHTHKRPDRNQYVTVHFDQIKKSKYKQFALGSSGIAIGPYDYDSIMHYGSFGGRDPKDKDCATMTINDGERVDDPCNAPEESLLSSYSNYSEWNYITISALYCERKFCGHNCASEARCSTHRVAENLRRFRAWERAQR